MVAAVSWCFQGEDGPPPEGDRRAAFRSGILVVKNPQFEPQRLGDIHFDEYDDELELIHSLVDLVHELDPDILAGWEVQRSSWGYLATRGREYGTSIIRDNVILRLTILCSALRISQLLSRAPDGSGHAGSDNWSTRHTSNFKVTGRHVLRELCFPYPASKVRGFPQRYHSHYKPFSEFQSIRLAHSRNGFVRVLQASRLAY